VEVERFEWDERKAEANLRKHKVSFPDATLVLEDEHRMEWLDDRDEHGEDRYATVGLGGARVLFVVYTERGNKLRLIMARRATRLETEEYYGDRKF
jgi:uncharacterized DUF497 family protein